MGIRGDKVLVAETDKDYQPLFLSFDAAIYKFSHTAAGTAGVCLCPFVSSLFLLLTELKVAHQLEIAVCDQTIVLSVISTVKVEEFVAHQLQGLFCPVLQLHGLFGRVGGYAMCRSAAKHAQHHRH